MSTKIKSGFTLLILLMIVSSVRTNCIPSFVFDDSKEESAIIQDSTLVLSLIQKHLNADKIKSCSNGLLQSLLKSDSLYKANKFEEYAFSLMDIGSEFRKNLDYELEKKSYFKALNIVEQENSIFGVAEANSYIGMYYWRRSVFDSSIIYLKRGLANYKEINDEKNYGIDLNSLGSAYYQLGLYDSALTNYVQSNLIRQKLNDKIGVSKTFTNIGLVYRDFQYLDKAKEYFQKGLDWAILSGDSNTIGYSYNNIASMLVLKGELDSALYYYDKSTKTYTDNGYSVNIMNLKDIGRTLYLKEDYNNSLKHLRDALKLAVIIDDRTSQAEINKFLGFVYFKMNDIQKAYTYLMNSLQISEDIGRKEIAKDNCLMLAQISEIQKKPATALSYYKKYHDLYDDIYNQQVSRKILFLEKQQEMEKNTTELQKQELKQNFITVFAIGFLITAVFLYNLNRKIKKANAVLSSNNDTIEKQSMELNEQNKHLTQLSKTQNKILSIMAHDLRSPYNAMLGFSELLLTDYEKLSDEEKIQIIGMIKTGIESANELLINLLYWTQVNVGKLECKPAKFEFNKMVYSTLGLARSIAAKKSINIEFDASEDVFVFADQTMIQIVLRNLLSNAIKFSSHNSSIKISSSIEGNLLSCSVIDSGIGIKNEEIESVFSTDKKIIHYGTDGEKGTGLGLSLCKEFVEMNNGQIEVHSVFEKGSTFTFLLPIYKEEI